MFFRKIFKFVNIRGDPCDFFRFFKKISKITLTPLFFHAAGEIFLRNASGLFCWKLGNLGQWRNPWTKAENYRKFFWEILVFKLKTFKKWKFLMKKWRFLVKKLRVTVSIRPPCRKTVSILLFSPSSFPNSFLFPFSIPHSLLPLLSLLYFLPISSLYLFALLPFSFSPIFK
jgi:hypothetical protein